jgi:ABC-type thiamine transport system substrate-binding protein
MDDGEDLSARYADEYAAAWAAAAEYKQAVEAATNKLLQVVAEHDAVRVIARAAAEELRKLADRLDAL